MRILDSGKALTEVADYREAAGQFARITLKTVLAKHSLDEIVGDRERIGSEVRKAMEAVIARWGLHVNKVEIEWVAGAKSPRRFSPPNAPMITNNNLRRFA